MKLLHLLNKCLPKKTKRIVFYSNLGFRDNVKALYDYMIKHGYQKKYTIVCASNEFYSTPKIDGVIYTNIYFGLFYFLFSKYFFYSFGKYPIKPSKNQVVVNLWHGMPLKRIGNLEEHLQKKNFNYFTYLVTSSKFFTPIMKKAFSATDAQMITVGNVRNDELFVYQKSNKIIWMPTYREIIDDLNDELLFSLSFDELECLNSILILNNYILYIKLHPLEKRKIMFGFTFSNIILLEDKYLSLKNITLYEFLGQTAALITDYSSVFVDYYLLNRPVAFTIGDINSYSQNRGFVVDNIQDLLIGYQLQTFNDLLNFIKDVIKNKDQYKEDRQVLNNQLNEIKNNFAETLLKKIGL